MANKTIDTLENVLIACGLTLGLNDIESLLGIILLSVQVGLILFKCVLAVYNKCKNKDINGAIKEIEKTKEEIDNINHDKK